jgi:hypothetical protein
VAHIRKGDIGRFLIFASGRCLHVGRKFIAILMQ